MSLIKRQLERLQFSSLQAREDRALQIATENRREGKTHGETLAEIRVYLDCRNYAEADSLIDAAMARRHEIRH